MAGLSAGFLPPSGLRAGLARGSAVGGAYLDGGAAPGFAGAAPDLAAGAAPGLAGAPGVWAAGFPGTAPGFAGAPGAAPGFAGAPGAAGLGRPAAGFSPGFEAGG